MADSSRSSEAMSSSPPLPDLRTPSMPDLRTASQRHLAAADNSLLDASDQSIPEPEARPTPEKEKEKPFPAATESTGLSPAISPMSVSHPVPLDLEQNVVEDVQLPAAEFQRPSMRIPLSSGQGGEAKKGKANGMQDSFGLLTGVPPWSVLRQTLHILQSCLRSRQRMHHLFFAEVTFPVLVVVMFCVYYRIVEQNTTAVGGFDLYGVYRAPPLGCTAPEQILAQSYSSDLPAERLWFSVDTKSLEAGGQANAEWSLRSNKVFREVVTAMLVRERFFERGGAVEWHDSGEDMTRLLCQGKNSSGLPLAAVTFTRQISLHTSCYRAGRRKTLKTTSSETLKGIHYVIHERDIPRAGRSFINVRPYESGKTRPYATQGLLGLQRALEYTVMYIAQNGLLFGNTTEGFPLIPADSLLWYQRYPPPSKEVSDRLFNMSQSAEGSLTKQMLARDHVFRRGGGPAMALSWIILFSLVVTQVVKMTQTGTNACLTAMGMSPVANGIATTLAACLVSLVPIFFQIFALNEFEALINIDTDILAVFFLCFVLSVLGAARLLAVFFTNPSHASVISVMVYSTVVAAGAVIAECDDSAGDNNCMADSQKRAASLLSPIAFILGFRKMIILVNDEGGRVSWESIKTGKAAEGAANLDSTDFSISTTLGMMVGDAFLYFLLAWYFSRVTQHGYNLYFPFQKSYWLRPPNVEPPRPIPDCEDYERLSESATPALSVRGLSASVPIYRRFSFGFCSGKRKVLDSIDVDLYEGQVLGILGSEGKSSFLRCLSGHLTPDSGDIYIENRLILPALFQYQMNIGLSPQTDAMYEMLTVYEHMILIAVLKDIPRLQVKAAVESMAAELDLLSLKDRRIFALSPGQKKKLQVALAFLGNPRVVLLDEPTLDMDPVSIRQVREVIRRFKKNRIVCLVTSSMQEAELVADSIAVFEGGRCRCIGSSAFLKKRFGCGYLLTIGKGPKMNLGATTTSQGSSCRPVHSRMPSMDVYTSFRSQKRGGDRDVNPLHTAIATPKPGGSMEFGTSDSFLKENPGGRVTPTTADQRSHNSMTGVVSPLCQQNLMNRLRVLSPSAFARELRTEIRMHIPLQCIQELVDVLYELETPGSSLNEEVTSWSLKMNGLEDVYLRLLEEEDVQVACPYGHVMTEVASKTRCHGLTGVQCTSSHQKKVHCFVCRITLCARCARQMEGVEHTSTLPHTHPSFSPEHIRIGPLVTSEALSPMRPHHLDSKTRMSDSLNTDVPTRSPAFRPTEEHLGKWPPISPERASEDRQGSMRSMSRCGNSFARAGYTPPLRYLDVVVNAPSPLSPEVRTPQAKIEGIPARFNSFWEDSAYQAYVESGDLGECGGYYPQPEGRPEAHCSPLEEAKTLQRATSSFGSEAKREPGSPSLPPHPQHPLKRPREMSSEETLTPTMRGSVERPSKESEERTDEDILLQLATDVSPKSGALTPRTALTPDSLGLSPKETSATQAATLAGSPDVHDDVGDLSMQFSDPSADSASGKRYERFRPSELKQVLHQDDSMLMREHTLPVDAIAETDEGDDGGEAAPHTPVTASGVNPHIDDSGEDTDGDSDTSWVPVKSPGRIAGERLPHVIFTQAAPAGPSVTESLQVLVMLKRYKVTRNNPRFVFFHIILPLCFIVTGLLALRYMTNHLNDGPIVQVKPTLIGTGEGRIPLKGDASHLNFSRILNGCITDVNAKNAGEEGVCPVMHPVADDVNLHTILTSSTTGFLMSGASFEVHNITEATIWYNSSSVHVLPAVLNLFTNAQMVDHTPLLETSSEDYNLTNELLLMFDGDYHVHITVHSIKDHASDNALPILIFALLVSVGMAFISAGFVVPAVNEHLSGSRLLQQTAGLSTSLYWMGHYVWDSFVSCGITVVVAALFAAFDPMFRHPEELLAMMSVTFLYLQASLFLTYFLSHFFAAAWKAQAVIAALYLVAMLIPLVLSVSISSSGATFLRSYNNLAIFATNPLYSLVTGWLILAEYIDAEDDVTASPFYLVRKPLYGLLIQFFSGLALLILYELRGVVRMYVKKKFPRPAGFYSEKERADTTDVRKPEEKEEVDAERKEVERMRSSGRVPPSGIVMEQLRKSYRTSGDHQTAVHSLDLYIPSGEIFALLGPTGAGKTTTADMLIGGLEPSQGSAFINGSSILTDMGTIRPALGICLQRRALIEELTVADHILLYATLKGIPQTSIGGLSDALMCTLDLHRYRYSVVGELGKSVTRRLSVLMAFIGRPKVLILDEPTAGMDVVGRKRAQRFMLSWLKQVRSEGCVLGGSAEASAAQQMCTAKSRPTALLTTHSIDEAQLFSTRLGFIVKGRLRRLGRLRDLVRKYGKGWSLAVRTPDDLHAQTFTSFLKTIEPRARVTSGRFGSVIYHLPRDTFAWRIFTAINENKQRFRIDDYTMSQLSLEEVFMKTVLNELPKTPIRPMKLNVVMLVVGTRGDVQPFLALALGMAQEGHAIRLATHAKFRDFVEGEVAARLVRNEKTKGDIGSISFFPLAGEPDALMTFMVENPDLVTIDSEKIRGYQDMMYNIFLSCWSACSTPVGFTPAVLVSNPPVQCHIHIAEKLQIPLQLHFTMPYTPTAMYPHPFAATNKFGNRQTYYMVEKFIWLGLGAKINELRARVLKLPEIKQATGLIEKVQIPQLYCMSEFVIQRPTDWGEHISMTGYWFLPPSPDYTPPAEIRAFISEGSAPIYVGFGSIVLQDAEAFARIVRNGIRRVLQADHEARFIVQMPEAALRVLDSLDQTRVLLWDRPVDHAWLFPHCRITVHHGGAGTVASSLASGCPMLIVPFFGDQLFWGKQIHKLRLGACIHHKDLTGQLFYQSVLRCSAWSVIQSTEEIGRSLREENGVQKGIQDFYSHLPIVETEVNGELVPAWEVSCYENQRYYPLLGWTDTLLPGDPFPWSDHSGRLSVERYSFPLPHGWQWVSDWKIDTEAFQADHQCFQYAPKWETKFHKRQSTLDLVRRRKWVRRRVETQIPHPNAEDERVAKLQMEVMLLNEQLREKQTIIHGLQQA